MTWLARSSIPWRSAARPCSWPTPLAKATILLCLAMIAAAVLRRSSAAVQHRLWALTLCGILVLPALSWMLPGWRLPVLPAMTGAAGSGASRPEPGRADTIGPPRALASAQPAFTAGRPEPGPDPRPGPAGEVPGDAP